MPPKRKTQPRQHIPYHAALRQAHLVCSQALEVTSRSSQQSAVRCYERQCRDWNISPWPVSFASLGPYFTFYCLRGLSAFSVKTLKSHIKRASDERRLPWLSASDAFFINDLQRSLEKRHQDPPRRKLPVTFDVLARIADKADTAALEDLQLLTMATLAHDCLLRGCELVNLTVGDVAWMDPHRTTADITIRKSKSNKTGPPELLFLQEYEARHQLCAVSYLRRYLDSVASLIGQDPLALPTATPLFPQDWLHPTAALPKRLFVDNFRALLVLAGIPAADYSGHSFRSGGTTDLFYAECRPFTIQRLGRWLSDAWRIYVRDRPHAQRAEIAKAFARASALLQADGR